MDSKIQEIIATVDQQNGPVIFDFDHTILAADCSELQFFDLIGRGLITEEKLKGQDLMPASSPLPVKAFYQNLLNAHHDSADHVRAHSWMVEALEDIPIGELLYSTLKEDFAFNESIIEILGAFLEKTEDVFIISASNRVTVQFIVQENLNPILEKLNYPQLKLENVHGIETQYESIEVLKIENNKIEWDQVKNIKLKRPITGPIPSGHGKVTYLQEKINAGKAYFVASDSKTDLPLLENSSHSVVVVKNQSEWVREHYPEFLYLT